MPAAQSLNLNEIDKIDGKCINEAANATSVPVRRISRSSMPIIEPHVVTLEQESEAIIDLEESDFFAVEEEYACQIQIHGEQVRYFNVIILEHLKETNVQYFIDFRNTELEILQRGHIRNGSSVRIA